MASNLIAMPHSSMLSKAMTLLEAEIPNVRIHVLIVECAHLLWGAQRGANQGMKKGPCPC